jgi:hypothetical protein
MSIYDTPQYIQYMHALLDKYTHAYAGSLMTFSVRLSICQAIVCESAAHVCLHILICMSLAYPQRVSVSLLCGC